MIKIFKYAKGKEWLFAIIAIALIVVQVWLELKIPDYMSKITTLIQTSSDPTKDILEQGGNMLLATVGSMVSAIIVGLFSALIAASTSKRLREQIFKKTVSFSLDEINEFSTASLITRSTNDITQVQMFIAIGLQLMIKAPITAIWAITKISTKNFEWTVATVVAVFVLMVMFAIIIIVALPRFKRIQTATDNLNRVVRENLTGLRVVRAFNGEAYQEKKFENSNDILTKTNLTTHRVMAIMQPTMTMVMSGISLAIYLIGANLISKATIETRIELFSDMVVFSSYAIQIIMSFMMLTMTFVLLPRASVSAKRILQVLKTEATIKDGSDKEGFETGTLEFKDVCYRYKDGSADTLCNLSFKVKKGETLAIIGSTGSGKSTLLNLIPRFYDASEGEVLIDGKNVKSYELKALRDKIGYVPQTSILFGGSVRDNVAYNDYDARSADLNKIDAALTIAQGKEFVDKLEGKTDYTVSQGGLNLSGGQKQRLSISRAIYKNPEILVFDDSFSALDYKTDKALRKALKKNTSGMTVIIVAQRIGTIKDADQIIVLDEGRIAGIGKHKELLKNNAIYKEIALSQLSEEELANA